MRHVRAFWPIADDTGTVYRPTDTIAHDPVATAVMLADMERDWRAFRRRWQHMAEFVTMVSADLEAA